MINSVFMLTLSLGVSFPIPVPDVHRRPVAGVVTAPPGTRWGEDGRLYPTRKLTLDDIEAILEVAEKVKHDPGRKPRTTMDWR